MFTAIGWKGFHLQELQVRELEDFIRKECNAVSIELQANQGAGDVIKTSRFQNTDFVIAQVPGGEKSLESRATVSTVINAIINNARCRFTSPYTSC